MKTTLRIIALLAATVFTMCAQERSRNERFETNFFPPQLLMENQRLLALTEDQKSVIKSEIQKAQTKFTDVEWQLKTEAETMEEILKNDKVDEQQALAQLEKVMNLEREMKKTQVTLMLRIKNKLSPDQQKKLREIRQRHWEEEKEEGEGGHEMEMKEREMREKREMQMKEREMREKGKSKKEKEEKELEEELR
jgi:Spy/CpxP family protein refolding chaperone